MSHPKVLCIIPAKGMSTRLKRKNILHIGGKTLLERAIDSAKISNICGRIIVSTEDTEIAKLAESYGAEVPFLRPDHLSVDPAGVVDVMLDVLRNINYDAFTSLLILLPTCPFRSSVDIQNAYHSYLTTKANFLMSVSEYPHSPYKAMTVNEGGFLQAVFPQFVKLKSQQLQKTFRPNGAIHIVCIKEFIKTKSYFGEPLLSYIMPRERSFDIDTCEDLQEAQAFWENKIHIKNL